VTTGERQHEFPFALSPSIALQALRRALSKSRSSFSMVKEEGLGFDRLSPNGSKHDDKRG
jgi:hypothetical protein